MKYLQRIALLAFFFSINFEVWDPLNTNGFFSLSKLTGYIYFVLMIPFLIQNNTNKSIKRIIFPVLVFFALLTLVSIAYVNSTSYSFFDFSIFQNIILLYVLLNHEQYDNYILEKGMLGFAVGSVVLAILFHAGIGIGYEGDRVTLFNDNQNNVGIRMSISCIVLLTTILQNRLQFSRLRILLLIPIPLMLTLLAESGSRVAFFSFILAFIVGGILFKTKKKWTKFLVLGLGIITFIFIWNFLMQVEVLNTRLLQSFEERDLSEREIIWQRLFPLIRNNLFFGVGETGYADYSHSTFGQLVSPHNVIIEILCYTGIFGLILYLIFLYRVYRDSYFLYKSEQWLLPLLLLMPVLGLLLSGQILFVKIGWIIFAYISGSFSVMKMNKDHSTIALTE